MLRFFTIGRTIAIFLGLLFLVGAAGLTLFLVDQKRTTLHDQAVEGAVWLSQSGIQQQLAIQFGDQKVMQEFLQRFLNRPLIASAAIFTAQGKLIESRDRSGETGGSVAAFSRVRGISNVQDIVEQTLPDELTGKPFLNLSIPVFSYANPMLYGADKDVFVRELAQARNQGAQHVLGYYQLGIDLSSLENELLEYTWRVGLTCLGFSLLACIILVLITRKISAPLSNLAQLASDISAGRLDRSFKARGTGEVYKIGAMLNMVLAELNSYKTRMDVDNNLLSMKVEERTAQLSKRNDELNKAVAQVTRTKNRLRQLAYYDSLTSLPNRQLFSEQLQLLLNIAKRDNIKIALLFLDLDNFKRINDSLGHNAGDALLREVAARLSGCIRESDLISQYFDNESRIDISRLGGDEFTVVLHKLEEKGIAGVVAERLLDALQTPMIIEGHEIVITPSIGIAVAPDDADSVEGLLKMADTAMYHAKTTGKNGYRFYSSAMRGTGVGRLKLEAELRKAIDQQDMVLHYQPQVDARTGEILGAEALVRWNHAEHGIIYPDRFIPLAEEMGLIVQLGAWTLLEACRHSIQMRDLGLKLPKVSVNVSSLQFNAAFIEMVEQVLKETGMEPQYLELELTEGVIMSNARSSTEALLQLKNLGVSLSVDDFGTGYSSLSYLSRFPLDELKIDRSFVIDYNKSTNGAKLVSAIIAMGKSLNLCTVAEGVDHNDQFRFLSAQGIDVIQGYLFSKPKPRDEFMLLLKSNPYPQQIKEILSQQD
ncbi:EAL domain-containing protein [Halieaceae bacterium IMCC14734]|uniref:EAL domain-containing protein n=1 Tax=Candidatus Litorirhabdus singularis TaxID=2518993 RepID=A0ABT3TBK7_9GAMM|nr:EAL domain-containing protein [Candidatus Litorirhabdus singularis]MCX2979659.1 EAL domain-containing protein [Candidatus Litorirhabdus singularis]